MAQPLLFVDGIKMIVRKVKGQASNMRKRFVEFDDAEIKVKPGIFWDFGDTSSEIKDTTDTTNGNGVQKWSKLGE